jgi:4-diphosphocytidyl-2-C-methyl-D-erythritol kinase
MQKLIIAAPAKINLSLDVVGRRADGFHLLSTVMQSIDLADRVTVSIDPTGSGIRLNCGRARIPSDNRNTAWRAAAIYMETAGLAAGVLIDIEKNIPTSAGLAGGSSDAAAVLFALDRLNPGRLSRPELFELASQVGADVPFCLLGGTVLCEGIGEQLTPLPAWSGLPVLLCKPPFGMSTPWVFSRFCIDNPGHRPTQPGVLKALQNRDLTGLAANTANVLESVSLLAYPILKEIKDKLIAAGAVVSLMSGSGPTIFGLFSDPSVCLAAKIELTKMMPANTIVVASQTCGTGPRILS